MSPLELTAALTSALGVWLTARRTLLCWPISLLACLLYGWVFLTARLYADTALQLVFSATILYGWHTWHISPKQHDTITIAHPTNKTLLRDLTLGALATTVLAITLTHYTDDPSPKLDALLSSYSIVAQIWMARRYTANWLVWIAVDALYTALFLHRGLTITAILYAAFIILALIGLHQWHKAEKTP